jgi:hypothetical protein
MENDFRDEINTSLVSLFSQRIGKFFFGLVSVSTITACLILIILTTSSRSQFRMLPEERIIFDLPIAKSFDLTVFNFETLELRFFFDFYFFSN